jgi:kynurenine formamidase
MDPPRTPDWRDLAASVRNWGRWGADDQIGTLNLIDAEAVRAAAALVRRGAVFDLGIPFDENGPQYGNGRTNPVRSMSVLGGSDPGGGSMRYNDDVVSMPLQTATQWDALSHVFYDGKLYNDTPAGVVTPAGASRLGIQHQAKGVFGRGVLLDVATHRGVDWLEAGEVITPGLLDDVVARQGVEIRKGDIVLVRTGWRRKFVREGDGRAFLAGEPGLGLACCRWLHEHDVAAVAGDNWAVEAIPGELPDEPFAVHMVLIRDMGMTLGEMFDLEELAEDCARDGVYEFLLTAPVLKFTGAVGSPVSPLAIK